MKITITCEFKYVVFILYICICLFPVLLQTRDPYVVNKSEATGYSSSSGVF
jgi:hypothetical protein